MQGRTAAVCTGTPPVKQGEDYCAILESLGATCSDEEIVRDGPIVTARQRSRYFVAGVIEAIATPTSPAQTVSLAESAQAFDARGTYQAGLGDLDGDGDLDAVFANPLTHDSEVWLNDGTGVFVDTDQQLTRYGHGVGVADLDGDGDLDAVIACHQFRTPSKVYLNDGAGVLSEAGDLGDASLSGTGLNLVDVNGDGVRSTSTSPTMPRAGSPTASTSTTEAHASPTAGSPSTKKRSPGEI